MNVQRLKTLIEEQIVQFQTISEDTWNAKPSELSWSKKEILGHLCDSALTNIRRFIVTQYKEKENIVYDQDFWVKAQHYQQTPISVVIDLWKSLNLQIVTIVENIPDHYLDNLCDTTKTEPQMYTLRFLIEDYINHLQHHLNAIHHE